MWYGSPLDRTDGAVLGKRAILLENPKPCSPFEPLSPLFHLGRVTPVGMEMEAAAAAQSAQGPPWLLPRDGGQARVRVGYRGQRGVRCEPRGAHRGDAPGFVEYEVHASRPAQLQQVLLHLGVKYVGDGARGDGHRWTPKTAGPSITGSIFVLLLEPP